MGLIYDLFATNSMSNFWLVFWETHKQSNIVADSYTTSYIKDSYIIILAYSCETKRKTKTLWKMVRPITQSQTEMLCMGAIWMGAWSLEE